MPSYFPKYVCINMRIMCAGQIQIHPLCHYYLYTEPKLPWGAVFEVQLFSFSTSLIATPMLFVFCSVTGHGYQSFCKITSYQNGCSKMYWMASFVYKIAKNSEYRSLIERPWTALWYPCHLTSFPIYEATMISWLYF